MFTSKFDRLFESITKDFKDLPEFKAKNKWIDVSKDSREEIKLNLYNIITSSYTGALGEKHFRILTPDDVVKDSQLTFWKAVDVDKNPDADAVIFGQKRNGFKISGFGHNGTKASVNSLMDELVKLLNNKSNGVWIEASGATERALRKRGAHVLDDQKKVEKLFNMDVDWGEYPNHPKIIKNPGKGWYKRVVNPANHAESSEVVFGNPKV